VEEGTDLRFFAPKHLSGKIGGDSEPPLPSGTSAHRYKESQSVESDYYSEMNLLLKFREGSSPPN
jgi:hypothetical protein